MGQPSVTLPSLTAPFLSRRDDLPGPSRARGLPLSALAAPLGLSVAQQFRRLLHPHVRVRQGAQRLFIGLWEQRFAPSAGGHSVASSQDSALWLHPVP